MDSAEVSPNFMVGFTSQHTMKIRGQMGRHDVLVLIDSGATHNFISNHLLRKLSLQIIDIGNFEVVMGIGQIERSCVMCQGS